VLEQVSETTRTPSSVARAALGRQLAGRSASE
jgi:hypothetical protein